MRRAAARSYRAPLLAAPSDRPGCSGKRQYGSHGEAAKVAKTMRRYTDNAMNPYRCRHCAAWHLGHKDRSACGRPAPAIRMQEE